MAWLPPDAGEAGSAVAAIKGAADEAEREVDADHFGISLPIAFGGIPDALAASIRRRRPDTDPAALIADGWAGARDRISAFADAGLSKFVVRPAAPASPAAPAAPAAPTAATQSFEDFVEGFTRELMPLQTLLSLLAARAGVG